MRKALLITTTAILSTFLFFGACSKDKKTNPVLTQGDPNDSTYIEAQGLAKDVVDSLSAFALDGFNYLSFNGTSPFKVSTDTAYINYDAITKWWVIYGHHDTSGENLTVRDSLRFEQGDTCSMFPDSLTTTGIDFRDSLDFNLIADSSNLSAQYGKRLHATGIQSPLVVFNGHTVAHISAAYGSISSLVYNYDASGTDVTFNHSDLDDYPNPHPVAGAIALSLNLHKVTPRSSVNTDWTIDIAFFADHYHIHFVSGANYWDWDGPYGG